MTTEKNYSEHSDVEVSVVEHPSGSETNTTPASLEGAAPVEAQVDEHNESQEPQEEVKSSNPDTANQDVRVEEVAKIEPETGIAEHGESSTFSYAEAIPQVEEVRPFTAYIEEFRQAEEARLSPSLQEEGAESPTLLTPVEEPGTPEFSTPPWENMLPESISSTIEVEGIEATRGEESQVADIASTAVPPVLEAPGESAPEPTTTESEAKRPVSPLLRPPSRLRLPRHGSGRQREEHATAEKAPAGEPQGGPVLTEPSSTEEQSRPARRYRFDRPAPTPAVASASTASASPAPVQPRTDESKDATQRSSKPANPRTGNRHGSSEQAEEEAELPRQPKQATSVSQPLEQSTPKQPVAQEQQAVEGGSVAAPAAPDHDRPRRHGQDRQRGKEQPTPAAPAAEVGTQFSAPTVTEPIASQKEEVAPEDLPPLEYSELQAASSRRRRRRRSGAAAPPTASTALAAKPMVPEVPPTPTPIPTPSVSMPRMPGTTVTPVGQYNIVSGYTVSQMNQSGDGPSPFMGPEPSAARGSVVARNVRSVRAEVQRAPTYPGRPSDPVPSSASVHHLANVVAQAIQSQTDRMVAELRRANQGPTNVAVSLPPFPSTERVGVFVDVANLLYSARTLRMTVDFGKLLDFLRGNRRLVRAHAYCPTSPQPGEDQMFLKAVKGLGYRITTKHYKTFSSGARKADLDLDLCMDVVRLVEGRAVDCIVLVSGDSDFMPMLDYCSDHGVRVEVAAFDESMSATLRQSCDLFVNLSMLDEIRA